MPAVHARVAAPLAASGSLVLDTNIVLNLLVFDDPTIHALKQALECGALTWLVTAAMRDELERVLDYPRIAARLHSLGQTCAEVLAQFDCLSRTTPEAPQTTVRCSDRDDQMFINLAVAHQARLLSKDRAVLRLRKRLVGLGVWVSCA